MNIVIDEDGINIYDNDKYLVGWQVGEFNKKGAEIAEAIQWALTDPEKLKEALLKLIPLPSDTNQQTRLQSIIDNNGLFFVPVRNKIGVNQRELFTLMEAYRRKNCIGKDKTYTDWLGLGVPYIYRNPFFKSVGEEIPRISNWYTLTPAGVEKLKAIEEYIGLPSAEQIRKLNLVLFNLGTSPQKY